MRKHYLNSASDPVEDCAFVHWATNSWTKLYKNLVTGISTKYIYKALQNKMNKTVWIFNIDH